MKTALSIFLFTILLIDPTKIGKINSVKAEAKKSFNEGNYKEAIQKYLYLIDSLGVEEDEVRLNLAHAYYMAKDTANARPIYQNLSTSMSNEIRSKSLQQVGLINNTQGKTELALNQFKQAIKANPHNDDARYNYEMLKKKLDEKKKQNEDQNKKDKDKQDQQNKNQEPSEFAKKLKEQADQLVAQRQYSQAYNLMMDGLKKDKTVSEYQEYISRIKDVSGIYK